VKEITLSDHPRSKIAEKAEERERNYQEAIGTWQEQQARYDDWKRAREREVRKGGLLARISSWLATLSTGEPKAPPYPVKPGPCAEERTWAQGAAAEDKVAAFFARQLGDDWTLVRGYCNPRGEIDQILVGPAGIVAMEVKNINGIVHCDGDRWWREKIDAYGNNVGTKDIADRLGRSPDRQVNEPTDILQDFLTRDFGDGQIGRVVVLAHEKSVRGQLKDPHVDLVAVLKDWEIRTLPCQVRRICDSDVSAIVSAIEQNHRFHDKKRA